MKLHAAEAARKGGNGKVRAASVGDESEASSVSIGEPEQVTI